MAITKEMYNEELRKFNFFGRMIAWMLCRKWGVWFFRCVDGMMKGKKIAELHNDELYITLNSESSGERRIRIRIFRPKGSEEKILPAILYMHGGAHVIGNPEIAQEFYKEIVKRRDVAIIAPDYRLCMDNPYPADFDDCYETLLWMKENAKELKVRGDKFVVAGHSSGGGLAAAVTLKARDTNDANVSFQMPIYPMLDHRMETESAKTMTTTPICNAAVNKFVWDHYLKGLDPEKPVPPYASPALNDNYKGFPPTITFVSYFEPFRDEVIAYAEALKAAGVPTKFRVFEGAWHAFEDIARGAAISNEANAFQYDAFEEYFDLYVLADGK